MTKTNLPEKLRRVINLRNLLIISILFLCIAPGSAWMDTLTNPLIFNPEYLSGDYYIKNSSLIPDFNVTDFECHCSMSLSHSATTNQGGLIVQPFTNQANGELADYGNTYGDYIAGGTVINTLTNASGTYNINWYGYENGTVKIYRDTTLSKTVTGIDYSIFTKGMNVNQFRHKTATANDPSIWNYYCEVNYAGEEYYDIIISATGTFCYGNPLTFNISLDRYTDQYAFYYLVFYKDGNPDSYYTAFDGNEDGYYTFTKSLPPGDYVSEGIIQFEEYELTDWLNFTVEEDCSIAFNGTITDINPYIYVTNHTWEWIYYDYLNNLTPFDVPTYDNGNGTSFIDYAYSNGYINETEYSFILIQVQNALNQSTNTTNMGNEYVFSVLTPLEMINDGIITVRSNINGSVSFLTDGISPITSIFSWILQMMPSWVINLFSIVLAFDATRIILAGRK